MRPERVHRFRSSGLGPAVSAMVSGNRVTLHSDAAALLAMRQAIESAQSEILLEMYWFDSDRTGWSFADALCDAAQAGVTVQVVYDGVGSINTDDAMFEAMRRAGCKVYEYHPIAPWRARFRWGRIGHRNHRKQLIVDQRLVMLGGVNLANPWAAVEDGGKGWIDDIVAIAGPAALAAREIFSHTYRTIEREVSEQVDPSRPTDRDGVGVELGDADVRLVANHFRDQRRLIRSAYVKQIGSAQRSVYIANSYFIPDGRTRRALMRAAGRGVQVHVLLPGVSDVPLVQWASRASYEALLRAGVHIHECGGAVMHAKTATVDSRWLTIGTFNLDARSLRYNLEINAMITDAQLASAAEARIAALIATAETIDLAQWRRRPHRARVIEFCARLLAPWL